MPGHPKPGGGTRDGEMVDHESFQRPPHPASGDLRPRRRCLRHVLPPGALAMITPVSTNPNLQRRGPVTERLMRKTTNHRIPNDALGAAPPTPRISLNGPALDHRPIRLQALPDSLQAELVKATEGSQIGRGKGSVEHVEVFPVDSVGTSILEDLDPYPPIAARILTTPSSAKSPFGKLECLALR